MRPRKRPAVYSHFPFKQLAVGIVASVTLLMLAAILTRNPMSPKGTNLPVNDVGILQLMWLFRQQSQLVEPVSHVKIPTTDNLREAGMYEAQMVGFSGQSRPNTSYSLIGLEDYDVTPLPWPDSDKQV